jgi:hypothetical protein
MNTWDPNAGLLVLKGKEDESWTPMCWETMTVLRLAKSYKQ